jgi:hypothetical protein
MRPNSFVLRRVLLLDRLLPTSSSPLYTRRPAQIVRPFHLLVTTFSGFRKSWPRPLWYGVRVLKVSVSSLDIQLANKPV